MYINNELCTNCAKCIPTCPVDAIYIDKELKQVVIDQDLCVECNACWRSGFCESEGLTQPDLEWPRIIRLWLSDPLVENPGTRIPGRGTEEMKTNDVTGRFKPGYVGIGVELGRPGVGASFVDIQKVTRACSKHNVEFCKQNPISSFIVDPNTGDMNPEVMGERVLSGIVEFEIPIGNAPAILKTLREVSNDLETVFSLDIINFVEPNGSSPAFDLLVAEGFSPSPNGKNNMGMGKPAYQFIGGQKE